MRLFTEAERFEVWDRRQAGEGNRSIGDALHCLELTSDALLIERKDRYDQ